MFTFCNTINEYYKLDTNELQKLYDDYKEYCNNNGIDFTDVSNFYDFDPVKWITTYVNIDKIQHIECNDFDLFIEIIKQNDRQEIRNKITELKEQIIKLEKML